MIIQREKLTKWLTLALMICLMCGVSSCSSDGDDDDLLLPYIGTWERSENSEMGTICQELVITETTFTVTMSIEMEGELIDVMIIKGTYSVNDDIFMLIITQFGIRMDEISEMTFFTPDDFDWDEILEEELEIGDHFKAKFVVTGNQLVLIIDANDDGVFDPIEEGETYIKDICEI
jgi:hypothetical protein